MEKFLFLNIQTNAANPAEQVKIKLRPDLAPNHVERITELANEGFYNGIVFHRVIAGFMAQGGDPTGTGTRGSDKPNLKQEFSTEPHVRGVCSMARTSDPNSANSQFFICYGDQRFLDRQYTVWGEVVEGMEVIDALPKGEPPREPGTIVSARVGSDEVVTDETSEAVAEESKDYVDVSLRLPLESYAVLGKLKLYQETDSDALVFGNALGTLAQLIELDKAGYTFAKVKDGVSEPLVLFDEPSEVEPA